MNQRRIKIAYFGGEPLGVPVLEALKAAGLTPELIVCNPDRPVGRKQVLTPPPVKIWAIEHGIEVMQPERIPQELADLGRLTTETWDLFVVVAYNKILPQWFIDLPKHQTLNVHPSLLPLLRGASPIRSTILNDMRQQCGVSVMILDKEMDHGPLLAQQKLEITPDAWPIAGPELDIALARLGGALLADTIPAWLDGNITPREQAHDQATYCGKITKDQAELTLDPHSLPTGAAAYQLYLKIQAYAGAPIAYFIHASNRYKITAAHLSDSGQLVIDSVIPEGKTETSFAQLF